MMSNLIKLTGAVSGKSVYVNIDDAFLIEQISEPVDDTKAEFIGKTMIFKDASSHPGVVEETPEEIAAMIQKYKDEQLRMGFIKSALTGICSQMGNPTDDAIVYICLNAALIGDAMMEELKDD